MKITIAVDEEVVAQARQRALHLGTSLEELVREYLQQLAGCVDPGRDAEEFARLSRMSQGDSKGWKFDRDAAYEAW